MTVAQLPREGSTPPLRLSANIALDVKGRLFRWRGPQLSDPHSGWNVAYAIVPP